ncbi:MAG TPA: hypothetical protein VM889_05465 [Candidatus Thermoplasmatota archaeon]|nr:hypothetical protein [Candidatus Thermoplasmatota archaeon]
MKGTLGTLGEKYLDRARRTVAESLILSEVAAAPRRREDLLARLSAFDPALDRDVAEDSLDRLLRDARAIETARGFEATSEGREEWDAARDLLARLAAGFAPTPLA